MQGAGSSREQGLWLRRGREKWTPYMFCPAQGECDATSQNSILLDISWGLRAAHPSSIGAGVGSPSTFLSLIEWPHIPSTSTPVLILQVRKLSH